MTHTQGLSLAGLEAVYDELAHAIDAVGIADSERFLVKFALLAANHIGDPDVVEDFIKAARQDL